MKTEQELFWETEFGNEYINRNNSEKNQDISLSCLNQFKEILQYCPSVESIIEFGSNIGNNIDALFKINKDLNLNAIEINPKACEILESKKICRVFNESIIDFETNERFDLTFTSGVLIHINPEKLNDVYDRLYKLSKNYILVIEYYNPTPVEVDYRGHSGKLFKRDFAGEILERFKDLSLVKYGFFYSKDPCYPRASNTNWFLLKKESLS